MPRMADRTDPRKIHFNQAIERSYMGLAPETGPSGYMSRLAGTPLQTFYFDIPADTAGAQELGDLPPHVLIKPLYYRHIVNSAGTLSLSIAARGAESAIALLTTADLTAVITASQALTYSGANILTQSRKLTATVASGAAGERVKFSLEAMVIPNEWY